MIIKKFFITDARESPGTVYEVNTSSESIFYQRREGNIYSIDFSGKRELYFVNANENAIYKIFHFFGLNWPGKFYTHSTYVRDIAHDSRGNIYFSEASGARENGIIYKVYGKTFKSASIFQEITISDVGGFWAGNFTFDHQDNLYISSGNRIPSSIYRFRDDIWEEIFRNEDEPIRGLTFLSCDLLCYTNWRSEIYLLDIQSGSRSMIYSNPIHFWISDIALYNPRIEEDTLHEGTKDYTCKSTCWRDDGMVDDRWDIFFPDIHEENDNIQSLLNSIGLTTDMTDDDNEIWNRVRTVWSWLQDHALGPDDPNFNDVCEYLNSLGSHPSIEDYAYMFLTYGGFCWEVHQTEDGYKGCSCMCKAQAFATLLHKVGIPSNRIAIAETKYRSGHGQHLYVVLGLGCHWYYIDPSTSSELNDTPENIGTAPLTFDYKHPKKLYLLPGSTLTKPMLVR